MLQNIYTVVNLGVLPFWAMMIFAPRWAMTQRLVHSILIPAIWAVMYVGVGILAKPGAVGTLADVHQAMSHEAMVLFGWIHYLTLDMFVGFWQLRDSQKHEIPHLLVAPTLVLTLAFGPAGFLSYVLLRYKWAGIEMTT